MKGYYYSVAKDITEPSNNELNVSKLSLFTLEKLQFDSQKTVDNFQW